MKVKRSSKEDIFEYIDLQENDVILYLGGRIDDDNLYPAGYRKYLKAKIKKQIAAGYKMHGNSIQAHIAYENLKKLDHKNNRLDEIRGYYNDKLGYNNTSGHLYRIRVSDNSKFVDMMKKEGIVCGIHYRHCHNKSFYECTDPLPISERESKQTVSLPFHEKLSKNDINKVITNVKQLANI